MTSAVYHGCKALNKTRKQESHNEAEKLALLSPICGHSINFCLALYVNIPPNIMWGLVNKTFIDFRIFQ